MENEVLLAVFIKLLDEKISSLPRTAGPRGLRGMSGHDGKNGRDGRDFVFSEHEEKIKIFAKEFAIKFADLTDEERESIRGPRGLNGKDFRLSEHREAIRSWIQESKFTFADFTPEEIESLRGPRGSNGEDGKSFSFEDHKEEITHILAEAVEALAPDLKLKFSDLSEEEREGLRGPQGARGLPGKSFNFDEHVEFFKTLKLQFSDLTEEEKASLKLRFSELTDAERDGLRLRFEHLTEEERLSLRGPRGLRGQRGKNGDTGERGLRGAIGPTGLMGLSGIDGRDGRDGVDGEDAPQIIDVQILNRSDEISLLFHFDNGDVLRTNWITLPKTSGHNFPFPFAVGGGSGGGSGGTGQDGADGADGVDGVDGKSAYQIWLDQGNSGTEQDFLDSFVGPRGQSAYMAWIWLGNVGTVADFIASLKGTPGVDGDDGINGTNGINGADGNDGKSAYELWLDNGNVGSEIDFLNSLVGPAGTGVNVEQILYAIDCDPSVYVSSAVCLNKTSFVEGVMDDWVRLSGVLELSAGSYSTIAVNGLADSLANSNVVGIVESKPSSTTCNIRVGGISDAPFFGLDVAEEYYLSDSAPGAIVDSLHTPTDPGTVLVKIGQAVGYNKLLLMRGDRVVNQ